MIESVDILTSLSVCNIHPILILSREKVNFLKKFLIFFIPRTLTSGASPQSKGFGFQEKQFVQKSCRLSSFLWAKNPIFLWKQNLVCVHPTSCLNERFTLT